MPKPSYSDLLHPREVQVLDAIARGLSDAQAGEELGLAPRTVAWYVHTIRQKLHTSNRVHTVARAYELGILGARSRVPSA